MSPSTGQAGKDQTSQDWFRSHIRRNVCGNVARRRTMTYASGPFGCVLAFALKFPSHLNCNEKDAGQNGSQFVANRSCGNKADCAWSYKYASCYIQFIRGMCSWVQKLLSKVTPTKTTEFWQWKRPTFVHIPLTFSAQPHVATDARHFRRPSPQTAPWHKDARLA